jgi:putative MATE family efflux protein
MPDERKSAKLFAIWRGEVDLTTGNLFWKIILFTLPVMLSSLMQLLYSTADLLVVGHFGGGAYSMAAVGNNGSLINLMVNTFVAISVGANVVVAKYKGMKDKDRCTKAMNVSMLVALALGIGVAIPGYFLAPYMLSAMQTKTEFIAWATSYLQIYFIGLPFLMIFNFGSAILRALGDSKRPLVALFACGLLNIALNFLFVIGFKMNGNGSDVAAVAITTVISEAMEAFLTLVFLMDKRYGYVRLSLRHFVLDKTELIEVLKNGIPAGLETLIFSITNVAIQTGANSFFDASVVAGSTASDTLEGYIFVILEAFAVALSSVSAQNYGANNKENLRKTLIYSFAIIGGLGAILGGIAAIWRVPLISLLVTDNGQEGFSYDAAVAAGSQRLMMMGLTYILCSFMDGYSGYLRGLGHPMAPTIVTFFCACVFRLVYVFALFYHISFLQNIVWLYAAYPFCWALATLIYTLILPYFQKKAFADIDARLASREVPAQA